MFAAVKKTKGRRGRNIINEINVTPMVDVVLVLLVIFMITAPMLVAGIDVDLPDTSLNTHKNEAKSPLTISINKNGEIFLFETKVDKVNLTDKLNKITKMNKETQIFVRGDKNLSYGFIMDIMGDIYAAGFTKVALLSNVK